MSTSLFSNFSMPTISTSSLSASAATRPRSFDSPHGLLMSMRPIFVAPNVAWAYWRSLMSTIASTADTRKT